MTAVDTRNIARDSLFQMAEIRSAGQGVGQQVRVRNLSAGGMMAEGELSVRTGEQVIIMLKNIGKVDGSVAWVQGNRCGIAFAREIDPKEARAPVGVGDTKSPKFTRVFPTSEPDPDRLRKI